MFNSNHWFSSFSQHSNAFRWSIWPINPLICAFSKADTILMSYSLLHMGKSEDQITTAQAKDYLLALDNIRIGNSMLWHRYTKFCIWIWLNDIMQQRWQNNKLFFLSGCWCYWGVLGFFLDWWVTHLSFSDGLLLRRLSVGLAFHIFILFNLAQYVLELRKCKVFFQMKVNILTQE